MVRKKSTAAKVKSRQEAYRRRVEAKKDSNCNDTASNQSEDKSFDPVNNKEYLENLNIIQSTIKKVVSKVCRLESERNRQKKLREKKNLLIATMENETLILKRNRQRDWFKRKYSENLSFRSKIQEHSLKENRYKYMQKTDFYLKETNRLRAHGLEKYRKNIEFRNKLIARSKKYFSNKYHLDKKQREQKIGKSKTYILNKYHNDRKFRQKIINRSKNCILSKYHNDIEFRRKRLAESKAYMFNKYRTNAIFRNQYKARQRIQEFDKYNNNNEIRLRKRKYAINFYRNNYTPNIQKQRQLYNQRRRIKKKYIIAQSHNCVLKHRNLYIKNLKIFRDVIQEGPDYTCRVCGLALFRNQVIPYIEEKYITKNMSFEMKERIQYYLNNCSSIEETWICKSCSDKIKKKEMPSRAIINKLEVSDVPSELKKLNDLERHLIALRLPFMKIVNLISGKLSSRLSQKGTKGPLHCVPSDVQDTALVLPRPVDKSMMVRLQLKRRLKYKAVWEEQLINPHDVRDALILLSKIHPAYKNIQINEIDENYLTSDRVDNIENNDESIIESMDVDIVVEDQNSTIEIEKTNEDCIKRLALGDIDNNNTKNDDEEEEDDKDIRTKYNIGTDCCTQPCDFNDFVVFDKQPSVVAPAEKNKLSSLLTDKSIEPLAFPHLFPDGKGSYDEERIVDLKWKEYCKARLFSADSRFAGDSSYIFFLQYLGDLKQVYSGINVAFRKKLPMNAKQSLDENQMKFLMKTDMIYRHLQTVRGSPQFWKQNLKNLFGMTRQIDFSHFFLTFSCADLRWKEFMNVFVRHSKKKIKESYTFEEKTKLLRSNPVLAARMFEKRFNTFMNLFIKGGAWSLGKVTDWFVRIEMQLRGSPHAHMPIWVKDAPKYSGPKTDNETRKKIVEFCDKYITTRFPSLNEDPILHNQIKDFQTHSRNHSKRCVRYPGKPCIFIFPRAVALRTFICEPIKIENDEDKERYKKIKKILIEMNAAMNLLEKEKVLSWSDFDNLLNKYNWTYDEYEFALRIIHTRPTIIHKREPNARWVNQYNEELLRAWDANMDIQFVLDPYACAKYIMSYTTKPEKEMSLLLEATHKECREGNMTVREEMKKLTGTFFNNRQVSVQEAIYRATKMPLIHSSRGFVFVPAHSNSCKFLKPPHILKQMDPEDNDIYMSNLADKYFDRPMDPEFDICMADFASEYEIKSVNNNIKNPKTPIKRLQTLNFAVKKRCNRNAIIRYPYFNRETDKENYFENLLCLYLPIRNRNELEKPYELFYQTGEVFDNRQQCLRKVKDIVKENRKKYEAHFKETEEIESLYNQLSLDMKENEWAEIVANKEKENAWSREIEEEDNPDFNIIHTKKNKNTSVDLKQNFFTTDEMRPLLDSMNEEQQHIFYHVREWCVNRLHDSDVEPLRLFITGGAGTGKSHLLKCLHYEATKIFSRKKHLALDESIDEVHTLITAFTGAAAVNVGGVTIHSAFGIGPQYNSMNDNLSSERLNTYRCKLSTLKLLFVDEVSLIQSSLWGAMHSRLSQIMGIHSNTAIFGNIGIIAIGDFYQCSPVASSSIYSSLLWTDHFQYVDLKINERQKTNVFFSQMLNRIRKIKKKEDMTKEDREALEKCHQRYLNNEYNPEALHLFAKNAQVDAHNEKLLDKICTNIRTLYEVNNNNIQMKANENKQSKKNSKPLRLAKNARVMITKNICVNDGLANGVTGRLVDFVENNNKEISHIIIKCDSSKVGRLHRVSCPHCHGKDTICVIRESNTVDRSDFDFQSKKGAKQFPLRLSWAMTIHKAQGITVNEVVISTKDLFGTGMGYTALSRVRILEGLFLIDLHFDKFYCNEIVDKVLSQMKKLETKIVKFEESPNSLNILFHNIEGLNCHFNGFCNHYMTKKVDVICLAETWLENDNQLNSVQMNGYQLVHRMRSSSFSTNHLLYGQKRGGVGIYLKESIRFKSIDLPKPINLELLCIEIENFNLILIVCYRSPQHNKKEFLNNLIAYLQQIDIQKKILLIGDLNEDSLQNKPKPIETDIENLGFVNIFKNLPTTSNDTSLDCIYSNFIKCKEKIGQIVETFYSFHEILFLSIKENIDDLNNLNETYENNNEIMEIDSSINKTMSQIIRYSKKQKYIEEKEDEKNDNNTIRQEAISKLLSDFNDINVNEKHLEKTNEYLNKKELNFLQTSKDGVSENSFPFTQIDFDEFDEQLSNINFRRVDIPGDGNCFFRAICYQLNIEQRNHRQFRSTAINYINKNKSFYEPFVTHPYRNIDDYISKMSRNNHYADHIVVAAMARLLEHNIIIHEYNKSPILIPGSNILDNQLNIVYLPDPFKPHYESINTLDGSIPFTDFDQMQTN
ncbi:unnamed protein product [Adineta steineri]|uniref:ATP-dependent DNA helicase n=1 Tax=Adineta steineri TaxID=433720 RepID=A0A815JLB5_9BILA|nr:unnamed protein product [Adineta steineri]